jgi:hypothetical protein
MTPVQLPFKRIRKQAWNAAAAPAFISDWISAEKNVNFRVRIQKPVVTYDSVSYDRKAVCPNLCAELPYIFIFKILPFLLNFADGLFGVKLQYLRAKTIKK